MKIKSVNIEKVDYKLVGIILMILSTFLFGLMAVFVKMVPDVSVSQKIFFRNILALAISAVYIKIKGSTYRGNNFKLLFIRCVLGIGGIGLYYYSISQLPIAEATLLYRTSPVFVVLLSIFFLKEKVNKYQIITMIIAIIGAILVIKPKFDYSIIPSIIGLLAAMFAASSYVALRGLRNYTPPETIVFIFSLFSTILTLPIVLYEGINLNYSQILILVGIGVSATMAQFAMTVSYKYAGASEMAVYGYLNIVFAAILGFIILSEVPDIVSFIGGSFIIFSGWLDYYLAKKYALKLELNKVEN